MRPLSFSGLPSTVPGVPLQPLTASSVMRSSILCSRDMPAERSTSASVITPETSIVYLTTTVPCASARRVAALYSGLAQALKSSFGAVRTGAGGQQTLTAADAEAIKDLSGVVAAAPVAPGGAQVVTPYGNWQTQVMGTTEDMLTVRNWTLASGTPFGESDVRSALRVALIGQTVKANLFGDDDPVGQTIRIKNMSFTVIGVLAAKGQSLDGRDQDDTILVPVTTAQRQLFAGRFGDTVRFIMVQAASADAMTGLQTEMTALLRDRHRLSLDQEDDFQIRNLAAMADTAAETAQVMTLMLAAIASISLVVGGIGIMNIMLVSVTERTREIGVRLAIGALEREVLLQFLIEAVVLAALGGLVGVALATIASIVLADVMQIPYLFNPTINLVSFLFSAGIGVVFGYFPARRAAQLDPIEALRHE